MYTAARTKLINDQVALWMQEKGAEGARTCRRQVLNLGAGLDTRAFWLEALQCKDDDDDDVVYWEVDTAPVLSYKQAVLDDLKGKGDLPDPFCVRKPVIIDFSKDSILSLPAKHGFQSGIATCWILEGLVMYLSRSDVEQLLDNLSELSVADSLLLLNFVNPSPKVPAKPDGCPSIDDIDQRLLLEGSWKKVDRLMFGDEGFNFGRYPEDRPANPYCGFALYRKE